MPSCQEGRYYPTPRKRPGWLRPFSPGHSSRGRDNPSRSKLSPAEKRPIARRPSARGTDCRHGGQIFLVPVASFWAHCFSTVWLRPQVAGCTGCGRWGSFLGRPTIVAASATLTANEVGFAPGDAKTVGAFCYCRGEVHILCV